MVWHAYMLNPRVYLEDCLRLGKMSLWATGMPWEAINASIDDQTFDYTPGIFAQTHFEFKNSLSWDNLQDLPHKVICCPLCRTDLECLWVQPIPIGAPITEPFRDAMAYTDKKFEIKCPSCKLLINHEKLRAVKFLNDMERLINLNVPMPGTILSFQGVPKTPTRIKHSVLFPSKLIRCLRRDILDELNFRTNSMASMDDVRSLIEKALKSEDMITRANRSISGTVTLEERRAIRRMMSRYWDNSSPFSVELVGAVIRQGTFTEKMDQIGWIHSPSLSFTMDRLKRKYEIFFRIAVDNPSRVTVPTLDVDLAWHTHQLSPQRYFIYSTNVARGRLLNHEDKVEDNKLSDGFKWTAKAYQDFTRGQVYSECICWYCEAIRESNGSNGYFSDGREQAAALHKQPDIPSDPTASPHISAHNSVRIRSKDPFSRGELLERKLRLDYDKAQRRFEKRAKKSKDKRNENRSGNNVPGPYGATAMVYGYPFFVPFYYPYSPDPSITCEMYSSNPLCVSMTAGEPGSCVSGTCALMAAEVLADLCVSGEDGGDGGDGGGGE